MIGSLILDDPRPSLTSTENLSNKQTQYEFGESDLENDKSPRQNTEESKEEALDKSEKYKSNSISMFADYPTEHKLGWPLLGRANLGISQSLHVREMSVVEWVMSLPDRSPHSSPQSSSSTEENPFKRSIDDIEDESSKNSSPSSVELQKDIEGMLNVNSLNCKLFDLDVLKSCTNHFSSGWLVTNY